jgi:hypothetical protein
MLGQVPRDVLLTTGFSEVVLPDIAIVAILFSLIALCPPVSKWLLEHPLATWIGGPILLLIPVTIVIVLTRYWLVPGIFRPAPVVLATTLLLCLAPLVVAHAVNGIMTKRWQGRNALLTWNRALIVGLCVMPAIASAVARMPIPLVTVCAPSATTGLGKSVPFQGNLITTSSSWAYIAEYNGTQAIQNGHPVFSHGQPAYTSVHGGVILVVPLSSVRQFTVGTPFGGSSCKP